MFLRKYQEELQRKYDPNNIFNNNPKPVEEPKPEVEVSEQKKKFTWWWNREKSTKVETQIQPEEKAKNKEEFKKAKKIKINEKQYQLNKSITVKKGEDILQDSTVEQKTYQRFVGKFNKKGVLNSKVYPMNVDSETEYTILGWATIDGEKYTLINSNVEGQVFLFDEQGKMYENVGMIEDDRLVFDTIGIDSYPENLLYRRQ